MNQKKAIVYFSHCCDEMVTHLKDRACEKCTTTTTKNRMYYSWLYCVSQKKKIVSYTMHPERTMNANEKKNTHFNSIATSEMVVISFFCHSPAVLTGYLYIYEFCVVWTLSRLVNSMSFQFSCSLVYFYHVWFSFFYLVSFVVSISLPDHTFCVNTIRFAHKFSFFIQLQ